MAMEFDVPRCPVCGELARGSLEQVPGLALLLFDEHGKAEYEGETTMFWDDQNTVHDENGRVTLECPAGHRWAARQIDEEQFAFQCHGDAVQLVEEAQKLGIQPEDLDEAVHDAASQSAAATTNGGIEEQIAFLVEQFGAEETRRLLKETATAQETPNNKE